MGWATSKFQDTIATIKRLWQLNKSILKAAVFLAYPSKMTQLATEAINFPCISHKISPLKNKRLFPRKLNKNSKGCHPLNQSVLHQVILNRCGFPQPTNNMLISSERNQQLLSKSCLCILNLIKVKTVSTTARTYLKRKNGILSRRWKMKLHRRTNWNTRG